MAATNVLAKFLPSGVMAWDQMKSEVEPWGEIRKYHVGDTSSCRDMFSAVLHIKPGWEVHPPHRHLEEEFLVIMGGSGLWYHQDKEIPARFGDVLFTEPWALHGIKNTGTETLLFFVSKWIGRETPLVAKSEIV